MYAMKKITKAIIILIMISACLLGCGKKKPQLVESGRFIKLSTTELGAVETYKMYTVNVEITKSGNVRIYASDFNKWIPTSAIPEEVFNIAPEEAAELYDLVDKSGIATLRENVGNRDQTEGTKKLITVYTTEGEHTTGGMNPSNRTFTKVYDKAYELVRERLFNYISTIDKQQLDGMKLRASEKLSVVSKDKSVVIDNQRINDVYILTPDDEYLDAPSSGTMPVRGDTAWTGSEKDSYYVALLIDDETKFSLMMKTELCSEEFPDSYDVYMGDRILFTFHVDKQIATNAIYVAKTNDLEEAQRIADELSEGLLH